jgi:hypothetical protein
MTAVYKAERLPVRVSLYAASKSVEFESDNSGHTLEEIREQVRRELMEADKDDGWKEKFEADVKRLRAIIIEQRDQQLKTWVADGVLSEEAAHKVRGMWAENGDRPFHIEDFAMPDGGRTWDQYQARMSEIRHHNRTLWFTRRRRHRLRHLIMLALADGEPYTPVQLQKAMFLADDFMREVFDTDITFGPTTTARSIRMSITT